jgi:hypothetical protein
MLVADRCWPQAAVGRLTNSIQPDQHHKQQLPYLSYSYIRSSMATPSSYPFGEKLRNLVSVVAGVVLFFVLLFSLFPLFEGINSNWQVNSAAATVRAVSTAIILALLLLLAMGFAAGFLAFIISTRKGLIHAFITGLVLCVLYMLAVGKDVPWGRVLQNTTDAIINLSVPVLLIAGPLLGGWAASKIKRKKQA